MCVWGGGGGATLLILLISLSCKACPIAKKSEINKMCVNKYDKIWKSGLANSPKAISYILFKNTIKLKNDIHQIIYTKLYTPNDIHQIIYTKLYTPNYIHQIIYTKLYTPKSVKHWIARFRLLITHL